MDKIMKKIYMNAPFFMKKAFANAEAIRRNIYRRSGQYLNYYENIDVLKMLTNYNDAEQVNKFNFLIDYVSKNITFYKDNINFKGIQSLTDIEKLPTTSKLLMRDKINSFVDNRSLKSLWQGNTSGSTGTPFSYFRDKNSMQFEYALYDKLYEFLADTDKFSKARISGVNIVKAEQTSPPFWYFIRVFDQLQCSAYHIDSKTYKLYLDAISRYKVKLGTGYASSWLFLAQYILENKVKSPFLKGIITDSEGLSNTDKFKVENAFNCPVYQTYGLGEVGMVALQCKNGHYHIFSDRCYVETIDESGKCVARGEEGEIVVTDLYSFNAPFIRYRTGDRGVLGQNECGCGWNGPYIKELCGRVDDFVLTPDGRKIGRLGLIARPAIGILGMQLIQNDIESLNINVLPSENFESKSMNDVIKVAKEYLGGMNITWNIVKELEKTKAGKVRYVIRKI